MLQKMAEDPRRLVRAGVVTALRRVAHGSADALVEDLHAWTDGYLQAAVAIEAIADRSVLDQVSSATGVLARLSEAFALVEAAPRAHQRTQGYRDVLRALSEAPSAMMSRFGQATSLWLEEHAKVEAPDLREAISKAAALARKHGHRTDHVEDALDRSAPPRRDPLTYVGPTRGRGKKARRR